MVLKNIKIWILQLEIPVLTFVNSDPRKTYCSMGALTHRNKSAAFTCGICLSM